MSEKDARTFYECDAIPGSGRPIFQVAFANLNPWSDTRVNYRNGDRAPLLLIAGGEDHIVPASLTRAIFKQYARSSAVTEYQEFPRRSHLIAAENRWEEVAEYALSWAIANTEAGTQVRRVA